MDSVVAWMVLTLVVIVVALMIAKNAKPREQKKWTSVNTYNNINWK